MFKSVNYICRVMGFVLILAQFVNGQNQRQQYFKIWLSSGCNGDAAHTLTRTSEISVTGSNPTIYIRLIGLWATETCDITSCTNRMIRTGSSGTGCTSFSIPSGSSRVALTRFGNSDQDEKAIHFFTDAALLGDKTTVGDSGVNGPTIAARSYYFTGIHTWDINNGEQCLRPTSTVITNGYGITYNPNSNISPQEVKFGCDSTTVTMTSTPATTTPVVQTSPQTGSTTPVVQTSPQTGSTTPVVQTSPQTGSTVTGSTVTPPTSTLSASNKLTVPTLAIFLVCISIIKFIS